MLGGFKNGRVVLSLANEPKWGYSLLPIVVISLSIQAFVLINLN